MSSDAQDWGNLYDEDDIDVIPELASCLSSTHARLSKFRRKGIPLGPEGERLFEMTSRFTARLEEGVAAEVRRARRPATSAVPAEAAVPRRALSYLSGLASVARGAYESTAGARATARVVGEVLPGLVAESARHDLSRLRVVAGPAVAEIGRRAAALVQVATAKASQDAQAVVARLGRFAKFGQDATVTPVGSPDPGLLHRGIRPLALVAAAGVLTFALTTGVAAKGPQGHAPSRLSVMVQPDEDSIDGLWRAGFGGASAPSLGDVDEEPEMAPVRRAAPARTAANPVAAQAPDVGAGVNAALDRLMGVKGSPSDAFLELAVATMGVNLDGDFDEANRRVGNMIWQAGDCVKAHGSVAKCKVSGDGVEIDLARGTHTATLHPMRAVSDKDRVVAVETPSDLRVVDRDAMVIVIHEANSDQIRKARAPEVEVDEEGVDNDAGGLAPRR